MPHPDRNTPPVLVRPGKHAVTVGDRVTIATAILTPDGLELKDVGWTGTVVALDLAAGTADVTRRSDHRVQLAGTRVVSIDRLTRTRQADR